MPVEKGGEGCRKRQGLADGRRGARLIPAGSTPSQSHKIFSQGILMTESTHVACPHCNAVNRVPSSRLGDHGTCGRCKGTLFDRKPLELNAANFDLHTGKSDIPVVVDFWAPWCGPCRAMAPHFEKAAAKLEPRVRLAKVNTEEEQGLAARFGIRSIPTLAVFRHGLEVGRQSGAMDAASLERWISQFI
jgi:thioredoxin 2